MIVPAWFISSMSLIGGMLMLAALYRFQHLPVSFKVGLILIAPALIGFSITYYIFNVGAVDIEDRQIAVRLLLSYLFLVIVIWQVILHKRGGKEL